MEKKDLLKFGGEYDNEGNLKPGTQQRITKLEIDMGKFFTAGQFSINNLIVTENGKPKFIEFKDGSNDVICMLADSDKFIDGIVKIEFNGKDFINSSIERYKLTAEWVNEDPNDVFTPELEGYVLAPLTQDAARIVKQFYSGK